MKNPITKLLACCALTAVGTVAQAQGLENIIVEEYYTITQADADHYNNEIGGTYPMAAGMKVYRIFVDMAPNYRFLTVFGDAPAAGETYNPNILDITTSTTFWNDDTYGDYVPTQTRRLDEGSAFDSYITIARTGTSGGAAGCGSNLEQLGIPRAYDTNGNLTMCNIFTGFQAGDNDGNIPGAVPSITTNLSGDMDFEAFTGSASSFNVVDDAWATLPSGMGVDPQGRNLMMIAQLTTSGNLSFHINVAISAPGGAIESYVWNEVVRVGQQVSPLMIYPVPVQPVDCQNVPGGTALPGTSCDDGLATTGNDTWTADCQCVGEVIDCLNVPGGTALPGTACNDNNATTENDTWSNDCVCAGTPIVTYDCEELQANIGDACNDNNASTEDDVINASCECVGTPIVTYDCEELQANIGDACNDNNASTENDMVNASCECVGTPIVTYDCEELQANIGDVCNDNNASTENDVVNASCECVGTPIVTYDCEELQANIGDACNDNNASTENDEINASCECVGTPIVTYDCEELQANIGDACNDNNASTENDVINASCECVGTPIVTYDCEELQANIGDACNDDNASTENDVINASCVCAGTPIVTYDCPALQANIGDACNDNNAGTINDVINASCVCAGTPTNCTENLQLAITLDAFGSQTTWQLKDETANVVAAGGPYADGLAGTVVNEAICVPQGCYQLVVNDNAGNGISAGGYVLTDAQGRRVVDATGNFGEVSQVLGGANNTVPQALCLPLSGARMLAGVCDKPSRLITAPVYASTVTGATMYQYWIFDPHGTYSRKLAVNSTQFVPANLLTLPVPVNVDLNICVRPMVNGAYLPFGQVCRYRFVPHGTSSSLSAMDLQTGVNLFPNPNRTRQVNLAFSGVVAEGLPIGIDLYDAFGKQVHSEQIAAADETFNHVLALDADLATGLYMVNITIDGQRFTKRLVLE